MATGWEAIYLDGSSLKQFDDGIEHLFKDIQQDKLLEFRLYHNNRVVSLFPQTGTFGLNGLLYDTDISNQKQKCRLIYFVRRQKILGLGEDINKHILGFQTSISGKSYKRLISICNNEIQFINEQ